MLPVVSVTGRVFAAKEEMRTVSGVFLPGRLWWPRGAVLLKRKGVPRGNIGALNAPLEVNFIFRRGGLKTNALLNTKSEWGAKHWVSGGTLGGVSLVPAA